MGSLMNFDSLQRGQAGAFELAEKACPHFSSIWWVKSGNHMKPLSVLGNQTTSKKRKFCMLKRLKVVGFVGWLLTPEFRRFKYVFNKILSDNGRSLWECLQLCVPKCCQLSSLSWAQKRLRRSHVRSSKACAVSTWCQHGVAICARICRESHSRTFSARRNLSDVWQIPFLEICRICHIKTATSDLSWGKPFEI